MRQSILISKFDKDLLMSLADFFEEGIKEGDLCVAVLTPKHLKALNKRLAANGVDYRKAAKTDQYLMLNARSLTPLIDFRNDFDEDTYRYKIECIAHLAAWKNQPVRAYGEVVGFKWPKLSLLVPQHE